MIFDLCNPLGAVQRPEVNLSVPDRAVNECLINVFFQHIYNAIEDGCLHEDPVCADAGLENGIWTQSSLNTRINNC